MTEPIVNNEPTTKPNDGIVTPPVNTTTPPVTPSIDIEDLLKKVRQDEKNKLYPEIEKLKEQLGEKTTKLNDAILLLHQKEEEVTALTAKIEEVRAEGTKDMDKTIQDLQKEVEKLTKQVADKDAEIAMVQSTYELKEYRAEKTKDVDESVLDLVTGSTKEEIDASIEKAKATYEKIASKFQSAPPATTPPAQSIVNQIPPVNMGVVNNDVFKDISVEDLWKLDPKSPEYAQLRKQLGLK